jgi:N-acetyl-1-D-myo-inositol-2-amino-2-deoxy-alpha-D-glucopyranoside deacetylase
VDSVDGRPGERVLFVHAHPDDESITTGGTIATLVASGAAVAVLTCTRGELGEVIDPGLAGLNGDALTRQRESELRAALTTLGVGDHWFLGDPGARLAGRTPRRYTDSGMVWGDDGRPLPLPDVAGDSLCAAEFGDVVADIATAIATVQPTAVVSYDEDGGYGHPDHVRVHEATEQATAVLGVPFWVIVPDAGASDTARRVDVRPVLDAKRAALRAYRSQLSLDGDTITHPGGQSEIVTTLESFERRGRHMPPTPGWAGLTRSGKVTTGVIAAVLGAAIGAIATVNHQLALTLPSGPLWVGVAASLLVISALLVGIRLYFGSRIPVAISAAAMLLMIGLFAMVGPGGSVLIPANFAGWLWAYGPVVIVALVIGWPRLSFPARGSMGGSPKSKESDPQ